MKRDQQGAPTPRQIFGKMVRYYRVRAGLSRQDVARQISKSLSLVQAIELGERSATMQVTEDMDRVFQADGDLLQLREEMAEALGYEAFAVWFRDWVHREAEAVRLRNFEPVIVPGLLQTKAYARAIIATRFGITADEIEEEVGLRLERQQILAREKPPALWVILDEWVLRRPVGGLDVMLEQINHLIEAAQQPHISIEIIPADTGAHTSLAGAFVIADFANEPSICHQEGSLRGVPIEEPDDVTSMELKWDTLRGMTLTRAASLARLEEAAKA
jgi:transcriptional regulator with XRE-family HTH domain